MSLQERLTRKIDYLWPDWRNMEESTSTAPFLQMFLTPTNNMKSLVKNLTLAVSLAALSTVAHATIIGGLVTSGSSPGTFVYLTTPLTTSTPLNTVGNNTFQTSNLYGFDEAQNVLVGPGALSVDELAGGGSGTIAAGTQVASHYIFFDPLSTESQTGYVDFDAKILAVITSTGLLSLSDYLANTGVNYLNPAARGLESGDSATIDSVLDYRLNVEWTASSPGDYVRVLTEHSPGAVPDNGATLAMLGSAFAGLAMLRRRFVK